MKIWITCIMLLWPLPTWAQSRLTTVVAGTAYTTLAVWDATLTISCVEANRCREANPLIAPWVNSHGIRSAMTAKLIVNTAMVGTAFYVARRYPEHRKLITASLFAMTAVQGYIVYHNYRVLNEVPH